jgi:hypothetical protein
MKSVTIGFFLLALQSCTAVQNTDLGQSNPNTCAGSINVPSGLTPVENPSLLNMALGAPGKGGLCLGEVFEVKKKHLVYRVYSSNTENQFGHWWTFDKPDNVSRAEYRQVEDICTSWSELDLMVACELVLDTELALGPGQSANCPGPPSMTYPASPNNQIYFASAQLSVAQCSTPVSWPISE